jgi:DNA invertase Pin-like site-specific DNA recombinase
MKPKTQAKTLRCAIYTRKSSEEGLEQGFNSLHAQREACEAYILSQVGEGWTAIKTLYDDGGFSGGSMDRPGLKALLADIAAGKIDVVVVYKVDRLTRSLADFAKIVERLDQHEVSFVSVTQAFNTTNSMGRLTLNVLLSFAQFEREVTGERIRDKILASKKKGMWMGGVPPLGYDPPTDNQTRALVVNAPEAALVRRIFEGYLEVGSVRTLEMQLAAEGVRSKQWVTKKGRRLGGYPINRGALLHLLKMRVYLGKVPHKDQSYPGAHPAIVDPTLFGRVQAKLASKAQRRGAILKRVAAMPLRGMIFNADGQPMTPTHTHSREGSLYRYYVSASLGLTEKVTSKSTIRRVKAELVETLVGDAIDRLAGGLAVDLQTAIVRVEVHPTTLQLVANRSAFFKRASDAEVEVQILSGRLADGERLLPETADPSRVRMVKPCRLKLHGGKCLIVDEAGQPADTKSRPDPALIKGLKSAHAHIAACADRPVGLLDDLALRVSPPGPYERNLCRVAFLAPDLQQLILEGRQPLGLTLTRILTSDLPPAWEDQRRLFGIAA